jgi:acyl-CoA thioester hydrolase
MTDELTPRAETSMSRRSATSFFEEVPGGPPPLSASVSRRVRFEEVDPLGIVWHGRYASFLEDGRTAFGERYGLGYLEMYRAGFAAPIVQMHLEYHQPLRCFEEFVIRATLHFTEAARLNFSYRLTRADDVVIGTGYTVQLLRDLEGELIVLRPEYLERFWERWRSGEVAP